MPPRQKETSQKRRRLGKEESAAAIFFFSFLVKSRSFVVRNQNNQHARPPPASREGVHDPIFVLRVVFGRGGARRVDPRRRRLRPIARSRRRQRRRLRHVHFGKDGKIGVLLFLNLFRVPEQSTSRLLFRSSGKEKRRNRKNELNWKDSFVFFFSSLFAAVIAVVIAYLSLSTSEKK